MRYFVTGANRGIGLEFVRQLAARGDEVVATCRDVDGAAQLQELYEEYPEQIKIKALDVSEPQSAYVTGRNLASEPIDVLINNAGVYPSSGSVGDLHFEEIRKGFEVNAVGPLRVIQALLGPLRQGEGKKIVNITSQMGSIEDNSSGGSYGYRMSKAALNMATASLACDLADEGIVAFVMHPGWVQTDMGGSSAKIDTHTSVESMLSQIDEAGPEESGAFLSWNGSRLPW